MTNADSLQFRIEQVRQRLSILRAETQVLENAERDLKIKLFQAENSEK